MRCVCGNIRRRGRQHDRRVLAAYPVEHGLAELGEEPQAHAIQEVFEETGLDVAIDRLIDVFHNPPEQGGATVLVLYAGHVNSGELRAGDDASEAGFFAPDELPELAFASTHHAIRMLGHVDEQS